MSPKNQALQQHKYKLLISERLPLARGYKNW